MLEQKIRYCQNLLKKQQILSENKRVSDRTKNNGFRTKRTTVDWIKRFLLTIVFFQNKIDDFKRKINEPESVTSKDTLTKERDELQQTLTKLVKKVETHIDCGQRQLSLLCAVTKPIETV